MVAGYHLIWTVYGYWLPNDPRGSTSTVIREERIKALGEIHYGRKKVQPSSAQLCHFFVEAGDVLKHPVLTLEDDDIALVGQSLGQAIAQRNYTCYACAVMPDHVHVLIRRHRDKAEDIIQHVRERSRAALISAGKRSAAHPVWTAGPGWKGFLNSQRDFERDIDYIRMNPVKIGKPAQCWGFVKEYDGWLLGYRRGK